VSARTIVATRIVGNADDMSGDVSMIAHLAFARGKRGDDDEEGGTRHLALLPKETLELDLSDPAQRISAATSCSS